MFDDSSRLLDARRRLEHDEKTMTLSPVEMESHSSIGEGSAKIFRPAKFRIVRLRSEILGVSRISALFAPIHLALL